MVTQKILVLLFQVRILVGLQAACPKQGARLSFLCQSAEWHTILYIQKKRSRASLTSCAILLKKIKRTRKKQKKISSWTSFLPCLYTNVCIEQHLMENNITTYYHLHLFILQLPRHQITESWQKQFNV